MLVQRLRLKYLIKYNIDLDYAIKTEAMVFVGLSWDAEINQCVNFNHLSCSKADANGNINY